MPLPIIIGGLAAVAGVTGVTKGVKGGAKMKYANDTLKTAKEIQARAVQELETAQKKTTTLMDDLGNQELKILSTFDDFSDIIEKIQGRPEFQKYEKEGVELPKYKPDELKKVSVGADVLLGGMGGAAAGTAGGIAAAGATTSAVMALGVASTGAAISTLSGAAATNAALAAIGGGAIAAGGGGMALGSVILGGATLGVGLLVGGLIFNVTGKKLSEKADEAYSQALETQQEVNKIVAFDTELMDAAGQFQKSLSNVQKQYEKHLSTLDHIVNFEEKIQWKDFTAKERRATENAVLLVGLLYKMCKVNLVNKQDGQDLNKVNTKKINIAINDAEIIMDEIGGKNK